MKLNPFRRGTATAAIDAAADAATPDPKKQSFEAPAPPPRFSARETPSRMYSLMLPSFTDRR